MRIISQIDATAWLAKHFMQVCKSQVLFIFGERINGHIIL